MVLYRKYQLRNGLTVLLHEAWDTLLCTVNMMYNVGARDENPSRTGFAHLFEHLMFGGTPAVPDFDAVVSNLGGECNAFTNNDFTNYYMTLPAEALPTALALEADRMAHLDISQRALEVQQHVVTEEYNQRYMNAPYGDLWLLLRPLCYKVHPYRWPTIGADIRHVCEASVEDVRHFHQRFYRPDNAILAIAAPVSCDEMLRMVEEAWHDEATPTPIAKSERLYPTEPPQRECRLLRVQREVPATQVVIAYPMCSYGDPLYRCCDLLTDLLSVGKSNRLRQHLVLEQGLMSEADAYITADRGPGLLVLSGRLQEGVSAEEGADALRREALKLTEGEVQLRELQKVLNINETNHHFAQYKAADRALALCQYTLLGDTDLINTDLDRYRQVSPAMLLDAARQVFRPEHENILYYERA